MFRPPSKIIYRDFGKIRLTSPENVRGIVIYGPGVMKENITN
jgi:hypothetical protein